MLKVTIGAHELPRLVSFLSDDLLHPKWRKQKPKNAHKTWGHCYIVSEACYHLYGRKAGFYPMVLSLRNNTHWFLRHDDGRIIDLTAEQFKDPPDYTKAKKAAFLTKGPSQRSMRLINKFMTVP